MMNLNKKFMIDRQPESHEKKLRDGATLTYRLFFHDEESIWKELLMLSTSDHAINHADTHDLAEGARCVLRGIFDSVDEGEGTFRSVREKILNCLES